MASSRKGAYHSLGEARSFPDAESTDIPEFSTEQKKSDSVVFDEDSESYNASLLPYATSSDGPAFKATDLTMWKNDSATKVSSHFKTRFEEIKSEYQSMVDQFSWNEIVYTAKFSFEPTLGETYHLYERGKRRTLPKSDSTRQLENELSWFIPTQYRPHVDEALKDYRLLDQVQYHYLSAA